MPQNVKDALITIIRDHGNMNLEDAEDFFKGMENSGRYAYETWQ